MRYSEDRPRSADIVRRALAFMGRQTAALNPCAFTLWYEHCAGLNPALSTALEARLDSGSPLDDTDVWQLYTRHIVARELQHYEGFRDELYRILKDTAADTDRAGREASEYDQSLMSHADQLAQPQPPEAIRATLAELLDDTSKMRTVTAELALKLQASTQEVNDLTESLQRAQTEALQDPLTGLKNRRGFQLVVEESQLLRGDLAGTTLLLLDIDHFKTVNDSHGHLLGDKVLRAVAHVLRSNIKGRDVAARLGGDEFAVLLPDTSLSGGTTLAQHMRALVAHGRIKRGAGEGAIGQVTLSVGLAVGRADDTLEILMARSDAALYEAKRLGRNRVEVAATDQHPS